MTDVTADALFERFFWPHYPAEVRARPTESLAVDANPGKNTALVAHLVDAAERFTDIAKGLFGAPLTLDGDGVSRLSHALDRKTRDRLLAASDPADPTNVFLNMVIHASAFVGEAIVRGHGGTWSMRNPMWESLVILPDTAQYHGRDAGAIPPFHWLLKHLADSEIDRGLLGHRFHVHVALATAAIEQWPVIRSPTKLPTLKEPTYDLLVKYLQQHLPELRDVGSGFPSPAEFTEIGFVSVGFELFHGGRVVVMHGQAPARGEHPSRIEIFWLNSGGFDHSDTIPCDAVPPYFARATGEALEVTTAWNERPYTHRIGFRGHGK